MTMITYKQFVETEFLPLYANSPRLLLRTLKPIFEFYVYPVIGSLEMDHIFPVHIAKVLSLLRTSQLSETTIADHYGYMHRVFKLAISMDFIHRDPCVTMFLHDTHVQFMFPESIAVHNLILESIEKLPLRNLYGFSYMAGFSIHELRPLHCSDYDAESNLLSVNTQKHKGRYLIPECALPYLKAELEYHADLPFIEDDLLFVTNTGSHVPHTHTRICTHVMQNLLRKPDFTTRDLWMGHGNMLYLTGSDDWS